MDFPFVSFLPEAVKRLDMVWTFLLLTTRYTAMFSIIPGIGMGSKGLRVRMAGILVLSYASALASPVAPLPETMVGLMSSAFSEGILGLVLGLIPTMIVAGVQTGGMLSSTTMGLGAAQLVDPTLGVNVNSLARIMGDLVVLLFLLLGGHYVLVYAASGLGGAIVPGTFLVNEDSTRLLINRSGDIFRVGAMISAPVIVALLLTQFVMGLITKAVPQVNIFIVSFPLTIGIGLVLTGLSLPDILVFVEREIVGIENTVLVLFGQ